jgi:hypothetical protein
MANWVSLKLLKCYYTGHRQKVWNKNAGCLFDLERGARSSAVFLLSAKPHHLRMTSPQIKKLYMCSFRFPFLHGPDARAADARIVLVSLVLSILTWPLATEITLQIRKTQQHATLLFRKAINNIWTDIIYFHFPCRTSKMRITNGHGEFDRYWWWV